MSVMRLTKNLKMDNGDRFILFYGNVNDQFCDDDLVLGNIDFMLWRHFKEMGFDRIVFFDGADKLIFYDQESRRLCLPEQKPAEGSNKSESSRLKGPLGEKKLLQVNSDSNPSVQPQSSKQQSRMSDLSALEILDFIMKSDDTSVPTVVIFPLAEDMRYFHGASLRELQNRLMKWIRDSYRKPHKCVFIFQQSSIEEVKELIGSYELHVVLNFVVQKQKHNDDANLIKIGFPDEAEVANLIHCSRLQRGMKVDWVILAKMAHFLSEQRLSTKALNAMLSGIGRLDKSALLEWNQAKSIKSTEHLIQNIDKDPNILDSAELRNKLSSIYCQEDNISQIIESLEIWYAQIEKRKPLSCFLVGTSGAGKIYTIELLSEALQPFGYEYCYFAMTEFSQEHTVSNLVGSPKGYVGSEDEPKLFEALNRSKRLVICFDEIEKAHEKILKALMQLLDKGFLSWSKGEGNFRECIICFTSNAQVVEMVRLKNNFIMNKKPTEGPEFQNEVRDVLVKANIAPEVCGRINKFLIYNPLTAEAIVSITYQEVKKLAGSYGLDVICIAPEFLAEVAQATANSPYGARPVQQMVAAKLGGVILSIKKSRPEINKIAIKKNMEGYQALRADEAIDAASHEEIIKKAELIVSKDKEVSSVRNTSVGRNIKSKTFTAAP